jgi:hypothetical protein
MQRFGEIFHCHIVFALFVGNVADARIFVSQFIYVAYRIACRCPVAIGSAPVRTARKAARKQPDKEKMFHLMMQYLLWFLTLSNFGTKLTIFLNESGIFQLRITNYELRADAQ